MKRSDTFEDLLASQARLQLIIWGAMTVSIVIHIGLAYVLTTMVPVKTQGLPEVLPQILFGLALVEAAASVLIRRHRLHPGRLLGIVRGPPNLEKLWRNPGSPGVDEARRAEIEGLPGSEQGLLGALLDLSQTNIICAAVNESIVIMGLVAALAAQKFTGVLPFAILGLCLNLLMIPRPRDQVEVLAQGVEKGAA